MVNAGYPLTAKKADGTDAAVTMQCNVSLNASPYEGGSVSG